MLESFSSRKDPKCTFEGDKRCCSLDSAIPGISDKRSLVLPRHTKDDSRSGSARDLAGLSDQGQQQIDGVKVTEAVDTKVSVNTVSVDTCINGESQHRPQRTIILLAPV
jgi:hypothetical protein